ncbi:hypothetical protein [Magnetospirillum molischianum]|uniref:Secreted protein n=1 Tax=Magnetospirillum molischianum DSM 120 TaxID=1150626 RepID=H8FVZ2_MAGML|nr:hypothetical protein [Magnetospirillum molischianum]CCG42530.1 conserved exported hypothetical protein [Magnetospirillum molischianum DSM 120]
MPVASRSILPLTAVFAVLAVPALASDVADVAREAKLPVAVVETTFANIDAFYAAPNGPANRLTSGLAKDLSLKAIRNRVSNLEDSVPGKVSEASAEEKHSTHRVAVRTTRHETTESQDCVDNRVTVIVSEELPAIKDGAFTFDSVHPKISTQVWDIGFCRSPLAGGGWSDWTPVK